MFNKSNNPLNLLLIFTLECVGLVAYFHLGLYLGSIILALVFSIVSATIWGVFRVDNDPNKAVVKVKGLVRLIIEWSFFAIATFIFIYTQNPKVGIVFAILVLIHYFFSQDRIKRLLKI